MNHIFKLQNSLRFALSNASGIETKYKEKNHWIKKPYKEADKLSKAS